ncbi:hypothetical protein OPV22_022460 [Ensete ventricosum]|uniref:Uncharacterized protein n=1 Tax=Ensete ventricosum TaxID=4639 RepID=A0AAV8QPX5_ENSVE|nr:hypothetical protein OPV22_022460 [Ensete ventricosum]
MTVRDAIKGRHREEASGGGGGVVGTLREHDGGKEFEVDLLLLGQQNFRYSPKLTTLFPYLSHDWSNLRLQDVAPTVRRQVSTGLHNKPCNRSDSP